jgi:hypothetical protein
VTDTITTWPAHTTEPIPVPLPRLGLCGECGDEIRIRSNGLLYVHGCVGDGRPPESTVKPTFAHWLHAQSKRRDDYTNRLTLLAGRHFRGCTLTRKLSPLDVEWATAEELHGRMHLVQLARTGSDLRNPQAGERCDWMCRDIAEADTVYQQLLAEAGDSFDAPEVEPTVIVRICRRDIGWVMPDYTDLESCTSNHFRAEDGRPACTAKAVWKVVEDHGMHLTISFWCDADLPDEYKPQQGAAA